MRADDPSVGIGRLENGEEARRGREKRTPGAQEGGTCGGALCRFLLALLAVADRKRRLMTVLVCFFACDSACVMRR